MPIQEIEELKRSFVSQLNPVSIYLFGSYAAGNFNDESDFDFYIVVNDDSTDLASLTSQAYRSIRHIKRRPVDIIVGSQSNFNTRKAIPSVESEVYNKGILLYGD